MTAAIQIDPVDDFVGHIYDGADGHIPFFGIDARTGRRMTQWDRRPKIAKHVNWWWPVATRRAVLEGTRRGGDADCLQLVAVVADIDVNGPNHSRTDLAESMEHAHQIVNRFPIPPTAVITSGGGLQAVWKLTEPADNDDGTHAFLARWGATWAAYGDEFGVHIDNVFDMARIMRLPGSWNAKQSVPVYVTFDADWTRTYGIDDLDQYTIDVPNPIASGQEPKTPYIGPDRPGDAFNATHTCADVLKLSGWSYSHKDNDGNEHWTRPGKDIRKGASATIYASDGWCCVWTDGVTGLTPKKNYDPLGLYVRLSHGGDFTAATRQLSEQGYGTRSVGSLDWVKSWEESPVPSLDDEWPDPQPLEVVADLPPFPIHCLPPWMSGICEHLADSVQIDIAVPAQVAIGVLSAALTRKASVDITPIIKDQPLNLYLCAASPSGAGKSPVFKELTRPLVEWQSELRKAAEHNVARSKAEKRIAERDLRTAVDVDEMMKLQAVTDSPLPPMPRVIVADATPESLVGLLEHHRNLALISDEAGLLDMVAGAYAANRVVNDKIYLNAWDGADYIRDRKGSGGAAPEETIVSNPLLTIAITAQPAVLASMSNARQLDDKGFLQRFMWALPEDRRGTRDRSRILGSDFDASTIAEYVARMMEMCRATYTMPVRLRFAWESSVRFAEWNQENEGRIGFGGDLEIVATWVAKQEASVGRLAALLHIANGNEWSSPITVDTLERSIEIGEWWAAHARAVWQMWGGDDLSGRQVRVIARWIERKGLDRFTLRDSYAANRNSLSTADEAVSALSVLVGLDWLRVEDGRDLNDTRRGMPSPVLVVNPKLHEVLHHARHARHARKRVDLDHTPYLTTPAPTDLTHAHDAHDAHDFEGAVAAHVCNPTTVSGDSTSSRTGPDPTFDVLA